MFKPARILHDGMKLEGLLGEFCRLVWFVRIFMVGMSTKLVRRTLIPLQGLYPDPILVDQPRIRSAENK